MVDNSKGPVPKLVLQTMEALCLYTHAYAIQGKSFYRSERERLCVRATF